MHVMVGLRSRFRTFCDFAFVSNAIAPSRNPYHMATTWIVSSWFIVANDMVRPSTRNASTSASDILITSRYLTPGPIGCSATGCTPVIRRFAPSWVGSAHVVELGNQSFGRDLAKSVLHDAGDLVPVDIEIEPHPDPTARPDVGGHEEPGRLLVDQRARHTWRRGTPECDAAFAVVVAEPHHERLRAPWDGR